MTKVQLITERLIDHLVPEIDRAKSIYILTSFAMKSGVNVIGDALKRAPSVEPISKSVQGIIFSSRSQKH